MLALVAFMAIAILAHPGQQCQEPHHPAAPDGALGILGDRKEKRPPRTLRGRPPRDAPAAWAGEEGFPPGRAFSVVDVLGRAGDLAGLLDLGDALRESLDLVLAGVQLRLQPLDAPDGTPVQEMLEDAWEPEIEPGHRLSSPFP